MDGPYLVVLESEWVVGYLDENGIKSFEMSSLKVSNSPSSTRLVLRFSS